ncbi:MAG: hypothetical protein WDN08_12895 [Rhizomicrobium sp.]
MLRVLLAAITVELLQIIGLMFAGGILLLWVCWKLYRDIREQAEEKKAQEALDSKPDKLGGPFSAEASAKLVPRAVIQIAAADLSMSLDNVLAVAGAAQKHVAVLAIGLTLSIGPDGRGGERDRQNPGALPVDQLCRAFHRALCRPHHDLAWRRRHHVRFRPGPLAHRTDVHAAARLTPPVNRASCLRA